MDEVIAQRRLPMRSSQRALRFNIAALDTPYPMVFPLPSMGLLDKSPQLADSSELLIWVAVDQPLDDMTTNSMQFLVDLGVRVHSAQVNVGWAPLRGRGGNASINWPGQGNPNGLANTLMVAKIPMCPDGVIRVTIEQNAGVAVGDLVVFCGAAVIPLAATVYAPAAIGNQPAGEGT